MKFELSDVEARVLGSLAEKAITTPEYYPLTLNALIAACNQKSSRFPVVTYTGVVVNDALNLLKEKSLARTIMGGDSRVPKYRQYLAEALELSPAQEALMILLLLRGPQTLGELRSRSERLYEFAEISAIEQVLNELSAREEPLIMRLPRQAGQKDVRYAQVLTGEPSLIEPYESPSAKSDRLAQLEAEVDYLRREIAQLQDDFLAFRKQFE